MRLLARSLAITALALTPLISFAQGPYIQNSQTGYTMGFISTSGGFSAGGSCVGSNIACIASTILYLINSVLVPVLFAVAFMVFLYGIAKAYVLSNGEPSEVERGHQLIFWGLIGFVAMISLWGLVNVVANTFGLFGGVAPTLPTSY